MAYQLNLVRCDNCKFFRQREEDKKSQRYDGWCEKDGNYTAEHRVCNKLPTNEDKRNAKINLYR